MLHNNTNVAIKKTLTNDDHAHAMLQYLGLVKKVCCLMILLLSIHNTLRCIIFIYLVI